MDDLDRSTSGSGFEFNHPTIIALLYLASCVTGVTAIVGIVLAYVWRGEATGDGDWQASHYQYLINTFWIGLIGSIIGGLLLIVVIGLLVLAAVGVLVIVRCVMSLLNAQKHLPMPNPGTWTV
ncbi:putative membrane protein [Novosphingobium sp. PhB165]|uniref:DUF4870 family protein n=1 Tax=Novosphingobium sp. PhB165 TaxID=2485105 RepID=UPI001042D59C|nr:hypothetical protein [Novosphingobium sp. PhB165]TCM17161.1 putative membrane protein [Novosphingobium sp. PhB165]